MGCHSLLQGIFLTQGWNSCLLCILNWQAHSLPLNQQESPLSLVLSSPLLSIYPQSTFLTCSFDKLFFPKMPLSFPLLALNLLVTLLGMLYPTSAFTSWDPWKPRSDSASPWSFPWFPLPDERSCLCLNPFSAQCPLFLQGPFQNIFVCYQYIHLCICGK